MRGALLRSGKSGSFTSLGETGQPVYRAALQLREAIRRKDPELVKHLAVPQSDELGNQIDWYSDIDGDVIPWSSATEEERAPAREQLERLKTSLQGLSQRFIGPEGDAHTGDKAVFGKLLKRVIHFPDENFVYLVQGKPVLTFWGFEHANADANRDPLMCLYPTPAAPLVFQLPPDEPVDAAPLAPVIARPWWRRWWWLLLLPLLLLLLLLLLSLRGCLPGVTLPVAGITSTEPETTEIRGQVPVVTDVNSTGAATVGSGSGVPVEGGAIEGPSAADEQATQQPQAEAPTPPAQAPEAAAVEPQTPPTTPGSPATSQPSTAGLSIPPAAPDGTADFLNGQYRAGAGIQDRKTGKPLRLEYKFNNGKGEVTVHRANGVNCTGPVSAAMKGGSLSIDSQGQAVCGDGSNYDMPKVDCRPGATSIADCTGGYGTEKFPMSMRQMGE
ncbi:SrfA family protein [Pseudomonas sp. R3-18-08]|uniref:SrfA family protein n=1 Tax=Pseudomonas sp. R3-18-08 TaxID=1173283 RepID=UPI000F58C9F5|nr:SrfA family protein [Pseudomonas sp. R3-18-08]AZF18607.1 Putative virulence factor [Pseudomonas sp. R3-18-08]